MENFPLRDTLNDGGSNMPPFIQQLPLLSYGTWMFLQSPGHSGFWDGFFPVSHIQAVPLHTEWLTGTVKAGWIPPSLLKCSDTQSAGAASSHGALSCFTARSISTRDWETPPSPWVSSDPWAAVHVLAPNPDMTPGCRSLHRSSIFISFINSLLLCQCILAV